MTSQLDELPPPAPTAQNGDDDWRVLFTKWAIFGFMIPLFGAVVNFARLPSRQPCDGVLCGLEGTVEALLYGYGFGALFAIAYGASRDRGLDKALSAFAGAIALPIWLAFFLG